MPFKTLPANPSLDHLKNQARDLRSAILARSPQALQRVREFHPRFHRASDNDILAAELTLSDAQLTIAREYCCSSWPKLKSAVQEGLPSDSARPYHERIQDPVFRKAVDLLDAGDEEGLRGYLVEHPQVVRQRVFFSIAEYFGQPTLLEFAAENPRRHGVLPPNIAGAVRVVLEAGAEDDHSAINRTLELVSSGNAARECGVQTALINVFCDFGADPNTAMRAALAHGEFEAAEALLQRGAHLDLPAASALGRVAEARDLLPGAVDVDRHLALALASQFGRTGIVKLLLEAGVDPNRFNPVGAHSHSTPLHQAALAGHLETVKLLVAHGADPNVKDILFNGTPLGWAQHGGQTAVAEFLGGVL